MEKNVNIVILKRNGDLLRIHSDVPRESFKIENGFVIIDLGPVGHMYNVSDVGSITFEEV